MTYMRGCQKVNPGLYTWLSGSDYMRGCQEVTPMTYMRGCQEVTPMTYMHGCQKVTPMTFMHGCQEVNPCLFPEVMSPMCKLSPLVWAPPKKMAPQLWKLCSNSNIWILNFSSKGLSEQHNNQIPQEWDWKWGYQRNEEIVLQKKQKFSITHFSQNRLMWNLWKE